jgi:hypothetical protein
LSFLSINLEAYLTKDICIGKCTILISKGGDWWRKWKQLSFQDLSSQPSITGTYYSTPSGVTAYKTSSYNSTEANSKLRMRKAFTVNNFATYITGGGGGTLNSRKNGVNGLPTLT